ncbi:MAG: TlpA family protein disulfide reductase [Blastocatellia bacterium]|nr:TlpA family protein disulfide reductase [Blastocatellia bacterium]
MTKLATIFFLFVLTAANAFGQQSLQVGNIAPDFAGESLAGRHYSLSELQGKVVVMTFWSTKCQICHSEIPKLNQVVDRYRGQDVVFLALTMEPQVRIEPYLKKNPFKFDIMPNSFGVVLKYADMDQKGTINMGFPAHFIINRKGAIAIKTGGWDKASNIDSHIARLLAE